VSTVPGAAFGPGAEHHVRLSLTTGTDMLNEGMDRLARLLAESSVSHRHSRVPTEVGKEIPR
jgi:aspartate/methionine/tyrosine aminotransferase